LEFLTKILSNEPQGIFEALQYHIFP